MNFLIAYIFIIIGINCIPLIIKIGTPELEKKVIRFLATTSVLFALMLLLHYVGYWLKGQYTNSIFIILFFISIFLYFIIVRVSIKKIVIILLMIPAIILGILMFYYGQSTGQYPMNSEYKIGNYPVGLMTCGERIKMTRQHFVIFEETIFEDNGICISGITNIEVSEFNEGYAVFLIFHNGEMDSENPYLYEVRNEGLW